MNNIKSVSWVRMVLAFAAILVVGGSGLALASGPASGYKPKSAFILGPTSVSRSGAKPTYTLLVTYTDNTTANITTGFTAVLGSFSGNTYTAPASGTKDRITGTDTELNTTVTAGTIINVTP